METTYTTCGMKAMWRRKRSLFSLFLRMQRVGLTLPIRGTATFDSYVFISPHRRVTKQFIYHHWSTKSKSDLLAIGCSTPEILLLPSRETDSRCLVFRIPDSDETMA